MDNDTKDHFKRVHEALDKTNNAVEKLLKAGRKDTAELTSDLSRALGEAKAALERATDDLKKHE
jgi:hypothetical protein